MVIPYGRATLKMYKSSSFEMSVLLRTVTEFIQRPLVPASVRMSFFTNSEMLICHLHISKLQQQLTNLYTCIVHSDYKVYLKMFCSQFGAVPQSAKSEGAGLWRGWHSWMGAVSA